MWWLIVSGFDCLTTFLTRFSSQNCFELSNLGTVCQWVRFGKSTCLFPRFYNSLIACHWSKTFGQSSNGWSISTCLKTAGMIQARFLPDLAVFDCFVGPQIMMQWADHIRLGSIVQRMSPSRRQQKVEERAWNLKEEYYKGETIKKNNQN
jgi:hypothetical protein